LILQIVIGPAHAITKLAFPISLKKKSSQIIHKKRQKKAKMKKIGQKKGNCEILFTNFCKKALSFFCVMTKLRVISCARRWKKDRNAVGK